MEDIMLMVSEIFLSTISELMERALQMLYLWAANNGLGVNCSKMDLMLFANKSKYLNLSFPYSVIQQFLCPP